MKKSIWVFAIMAAWAAFAASPASAQAIRTWVSGVGDDANPCSRTAPCKTFAGAISKTAASGEINCLDPGSFGAVTITKSITLDCTSLFGGISNASGTTGIIVNMSGNPADVDRTVRLRGLSIKGTGANSGSNGIRIVDANVVHIENVAIFDQSASGVRDDRTTGGTRLYMKDVTLRKIEGAGISLAAQNGNAVVLDNVSSLNNGYGLGIASGNRATVIRSVFSGNANSGIVLDPGGYAAVASSVISNNNIGVQNTGQAALAEVFLSSNNQAITGNLISFGNNRVFGNVSLGGTLVGAGGASTDLGQQ